MPITYNGYGFHAHAAATVHTEYVYDEAGLTVIATKNILSVRAISTVSGGDSCDNLEVKMQAIKSQLSRAGMPLVMEKIGFGSDIVENGLIINANETGAVWDIAGGPKPLSFDWQPLGSFRAVEITWQCEFTLSPCPHTAEGLAAFNYGVSFSVNHSGHSTRTISGYLQIAQRQTGGAHNPFAQNTLQYSADSYREQIHLPIPPAYQRTQQFEVSKDQSRLYFTFIDTEIEGPSAYPEGVISIRAPLRTQYKMFIEEDQYIDSSMTVELELAPNQPRIRALDIFDSLLRYRLELFGESSGLIVREFDVVDDPFSNRYFFNVRWSATGALNEHMKNSRLFQVIPLTWIAWGNSLASIRGVRGYSGGDHNTPVKLRSLCDPSGPEPGPTNGPNIPPPSALSILCNSRPSPERSWFDQDTQLIEAPQLESTYHATYGNVSVLQSEFNPGKTGQDRGPLVNVDTSGYEGSFSDAPPNMRWIYKGSIRRLGYPIPPLGKLTIGGKPAKIVGTPFMSSRLVGYSFCLPIYEAVWNIGLVLKESPTRIEDDETDPTGSILADLTSGSTGGEG